MATNGETKACGQCGEMTAVFDRRTHSRMVAAMGHTDRLPDPRIGPGWTCAACGHIEEVEPDA